MTQNIGQQVLMKKNGNPNIVNELSSHPLYEKEKNIGQEYNNFGTNSVSGSNGAHKKPNSSQSPWRYNRVNQYQNS